MFRWKPTQNDLDVLAIVRNDLYQIVVLNDWERVELNQLLNRLLVIFQQPTVLNIYHKNEQDHRFYFKMTTFDDPLNGPKYRDYLRGVEARKGEDDVIEKQLIRIFNTNYYLLVHQIVREEHTISGGQMSLTFQPYAKKHTCLNILCRLLSSRSNIKNKFFNEILQGDRYWESLFEKTFNPNRKRTYLPEFPKSSEIDFTFLRDDIAEYFGSILEEPYKKATERSPLISYLEKSRPSNLCFFIRTYEDVNTRFYGNYDFSTRMIIPPTQRDEFKRTISALLPFLDNPNQLWRQVGKEKFMAHFPDVSYIELLKNYIDSNGIEPLIGLLQKPYGKYARCFVDSVFSSGFLDTRRDPLGTKYGLDRIELEKEKRDKDVVDDKIRMVTLFYLFNAMTPEIYDSNLSPNIACLVKPLRISASPYLCKVTFTEFLDVSRESYTNWQLYHHFYYDIAIPMGRQIRMLIREKHLKCISDIVSDELTEVWEIKEESNSEQWDLLLATERINKKLDSLSRLFPFHLIQIQPIRSYQGRSVFVVPLSEVGILACLKFTHYKNSYYSTLTNSTIYNNEKEIHDAINSGIQRFYHRIGNS